MSWIEDSVTSESGKKLQAGVDALKKVLDSIGKTHGAPDKVKKNLPGILRKAIHGWSSSQEKAANVAGFFIHKSS